MVIPEYRDWLLADDSDLPTKQLTLLQSMIGHRLLNITRYIFGSPEDKHYISWIFSTEHFFRKGDGPIALDLEGLPTIHFGGGYDYHWDEKSISVRLKAPGIMIQGSHVGRLYSLSDQEFIDERLPRFVGQTIERIRILIRQVELVPDMACALEDGIEMSFANGDSFIISYYLDQHGTRTVQILYPEELRWNAVAHIVDVAKGHLPWVYRFRRWFWRALDRFGRRFNLE